MLKKFNMVASEHLSPLSLLVVAMSGMPTRGICHICARMPRVYLDDLRTAMLKYRC